MLMTRSLLFFFLCFPFCFSANAQFTGIGDWSPFFSWFQPLGFQPVQNHLFSAHNPGIVKYFTENQNQQLHKLNGLNNSPVQAFGIDPLLYSIAFNESRPPATTDFAAIPEAPGFPSSSDAALASSHSLVIFQDGSFNFLSRKGILFQRGLLDFVVPKWRKVIKIICWKGFAYVLTEAGIAVVNLITEEITANWQPGFNVQSPLEPENTVFDLAVYKGRWVVATQQGVFEAPLRGVNLSNPNNWQKKIIREANQDFSNLPYRALAVFPFPSGQSVLPGFPQPSNPTHLLLATLDQVLSLSEESLANNPNGTVIYARLLPPNATGNQIDTIQKLVTGNRQLAIVGTNAIQLFGNSSLVQPPATEPLLPGMSLGFLPPPTSTPLNSPQPTDAAYFQNSWWVSDRRAGINQIEQNILTNRTSAGPFQNPTQVFGDGTTLLTGVPGLDLFQGTNWFPFLIGNKTNPLLNNILQEEFQATQIARNPLNNWCAVATDHEALYAFKFNTTESNTTGIPFSDFYTVLQKSSSTGNNIPFNNIEIGGLFFDDQSRLWFSFLAPGFGWRIGIWIPPGTNGTNNSGNGQLLFLQPPSNIPNGIPRKILVDPQGRTWVVLSNQGIVCIQTTPDLQNTSDDRWKFFGAGANSGNLPSTVVRDMDVDNNGFLWVGTANGIAFLPCTSNPFADNCNFFSPIVQNDNFAGFLFQGQSITSIRVDPGNRKWVGTNAGVWLLSESGDRILERFTAENSFLPENNILNISVEKRIGQVYISTSTGLVAYRGSAAAAPRSKELQAVRVFPNPVPPQYTGLIGIRDLPNGALVKITDLNGRLIYQTKALGGQAVWNGNDPSGRKAATGVYLILVQEESASALNEGRNKTEKLAGKIVIVSQ